MAPTETTILSNYLTVAAKLPAILTLEQFTAYFPKNLQAHPQVKILYRHLQHQRNESVEAVLEGIADEERRGKAMRREVARAKQEAADDEHDVELEIERALYGIADGLGPKHTINSIIPELDSAIAGIEGDLERLEAEEAALRASIQQTVGGLSDLRYGRLANARLPEEIVHGLKSLQGQCDLKS